MIDCYCCSGKYFENCCEIFLSGTTKTTTAEELMRSRYSAYVTVNVEYILKTTHPSTRKFQNSESIGQWARSNTWQTLEIVSTGNEIIEFKAYFLDSDLNPQIHHEVSTFKKELGKWFFVDGKTPNT
jgi:SEC-C motif domain protein